MKWASQPGRHERDDDRPAAMGRKHGLEGRAVLG